MAMNCYIVMALLVWPLNAAMFFRSLQGQFPRIAVQSRRGHMGVSIVLGALFTAIWPIGVFVVFCLTGFAEFGIIRQKSRESQ